VTVFIYIADLCKCNRMLRYRMAICKNDDVLVLIYDYENWALNRTNTRKAEMTKMKF
jgi:hypothetical protein